MNSLLAESWPVPHDSLPSSVRTLRGSNFDARLDRWFFHDGVNTVSVNFALFPAAVSTSLVISVKRVLMWYAENLSPGQLQSHFSNLRRIFLFIEKQRAGAINEITAQDLMSYRASLAGNDEWYLGAVSSCLKKWRAMEIPGVSSEAVKFLSQVRLKGTEKGKAILTMDLLNGPFTEIEIQAIRDSLNDAYAIGRVNLQEYVLAYFFILLGQRKIQFALMKVRDVSVVQRLDGTLDYVIRIPRVKQSTENQRDEFKERLLTPAFGELLIRYKDEVKEQFEQLLDDPLDAPLFPAQRRAKGQPKQFEYHRSSDSLGQTLTRVISSLNARSERTAEVIHITPTRFRRTIGTRAAKEGHGELVIAELLDHSDTQNAGVYVRATPEIIERIDKAISLQLAPLAQAFKGQIVADELHAIRGDDPTSRIVDPRFDREFKPMGNCGRHGACHFHAPIACYTCNSFQAWSNGPHEEVLNFLIAERERLMANTDDRIASINDRTILAVAEVVRLCKKRLSNGGAKA